MNIVIVAGGLNTRFEEYSIFPKLLLPYKNNDSVLIHNLKIFEKEKNFDKVYVLIRSDYYRMVLSYITVNGLNIRLISVGKPSSNYDSIMNALHILPKENLLFIWSDLVFTERPKMKKQKGIVVFTDDSVHYRFYAKGNEIRKTTRIGNVPGIYYVENSEDLLGGIRNSGFDLTQHLSGRNIKVKKLKCKIFEFIDKDTYIDFLNKEKEEKIVPRRFNDIEIKCGKFIKTQKDTSSKLLLDEVNWYKMCNQAYHPKLLECSSHRYVTEYLKGYETLHKLATSTGKENTKRLVDLALKDLKSLHKDKKSFPKYQIESDLETEFFYKVLNRVYDVSGMLINYDEHKLNIILKKALDYIEKNVDNENYSFIHGDPNGSNVMINPDDLDIKFVDPRGYFGETKLYGIPEYDFAKLNYFLYGYDDFNISNNYLYSKSGYDKPKVLYKHKELDTKLYRIMVGIIYIALTSYISNNIFKVNIAYEHGLEILKGELE